MENVKNRSAYWDNIKGLLILLTVFAHILYQLQDISGYIDLITDIIYTFHMPAFVFASGYFGKSGHSRSKESIFKLVFLYFIFNSLMGFAYGFTSVLQPMYSFWYIPALIFWRLTAHHIAKFRYALPVLCAAALFAGFYSGIDNTFAAARIIAFYPYYMFGYNLSRDDSDKLEKKKYIKRAAAGGLLALSAFVISFICIAVFRYSDDALVMAGYEKTSDFLGRAALMVIAFSSIAALRNLSPDKKLPLITMTGRNSLWIFIIHRPLTLMISDYLIYLPFWLIIIISAAAAVLLCLILGNDIICRYLDKFSVSGEKLLNAEKLKITNPASIAALVIAFAFVITNITWLYNDTSVPASINSSDNEINDNNEDIIYNTMTDQQKAKFDNAFRITFAGDLILLEDQVKRAYNGNGYDFSDVFEYAEKYISSADLAVGVFEGPMASEKEGYTGSNYDDGKELYLNFPDEFAGAVKSAGFDLVTTANNHVLDKGEKGALRTLDVLDRIGLDHTGSYRNEEEKKKEHIKLLKCDGIKIAFLSYTYGSNYYQNEELINGSLSYLTSLICGTEGEQFEKLKASVEEDFRQAKALDPDLIIVLPHIGTQFLNEPDNEQKVWFDIFKENGADIILGDHPHVVEPALIEEYNGRSVFTAYCPGNFANIYRENQGDTSMLTDVYIDRSTKEVIGGSIVPLYTHARADGNFRAVPVYDIMNDKTLRGQLTTDDISFADKANKLITRVVFGHEMDISSVTERYYFDISGFLRTKTYTLEADEKIKSSMLYKEIEKSSSVCFLGDSVTEGTKNGGCPWYEPIEGMFRNKDISSFSKGGCTVSYLTDNIDSIPSAELYIIAIGTNDVRYRDKSVCAMTAEEYTARIGTLSDMLKKKSPYARLIFIAPWYSTDGDPFCELTFSEKTKLNDEYSAALERYCKDSGAGFINANGYIKNVLDKEPDRTYLLDHIHPNSTAGVKMYSASVMN